MIEEFKREDAKLHDYGYKYNGETTIYDLYSIEVRQLLDGKNLLDQKRSYISEHGWREWVLNENAKVKDRRRN